MKQAGIKTIKRRRQENKTDYGKRLKLLKGETPRLVLRKTNRYLIAQYISSKEAQDKIEFGVTSKILLEYDFPKEGNLKSVTASYLFGYYLGNKISKEKISKPIIDFGMAKTIHKNKIYAFIKGLIDSGLEISCKEEAFPDEDRINGKHLKNKVNVPEIIKKISGSSKLENKILDDIKVKTKIEKNIK